METTAPLPVPIFTPLQEDGFSCARCVKMILMFVKNTFEDNTIPDLSLEEIGSIVETDGDGTYPDKIPNLNKVREIFRSRPAIEFEFKEKSHAKEELEIETSLGQPPIAWIWSYDKEQLHQFHHAVVVTGIEEGKVFYNDPIFGKKSESMDVFLSKWDDEDRILVKVRIVRRLEEFLSADLNKQEQQEIIKEGQ